MKLMFSLPPMGGPVDIHWQKGNSAYLAVSGSQSQVQVYDRNGTPFEIIALQQPTIAVDWNHDGAHLAIAQERSNMVVVWDVLTRRCRNVDSTMKDAITAIGFSKVTNCLAMGTSKGNLIIFDKGKVTPVVGKHSKRITMVDWSMKDNLLAMYGDDRRVTISSVTGDTVAVLEVRSDLTMLKFGQHCISRNAEVPAGWRYITGISNKGKNLQVTDFLSTIRTPTDLNFKPEYGHIVHYTRCNQNLAVLGFSRGYLAAMELGTLDGSNPTHFKELFNVHDHSNSVAAVAAAPLSGRIACSGDNCIKVRSLDDTSLVTNVVDVEDAQNNLDGLAWSGDEQLLAVSLKDGAVQVYLAHLAVIGSCCGDTALYLSNLKELSFLFAGDPVPVRTQILQEVSDLALGPYHAASVSGNLVTYFCITPSGLDVLYETEFPSRILKVALGEDYAAVLMDNGKIRLHMIDGERTGHGHETATFPSKKGPSEFVTCCDFQSGFLAFGLKNGDIRLFLVEEWDTAYHYKHSCGIRDIYLAPCGLMMCFVDDKKVAYILKMAVLGINRMFYEKSNPCFLVTDACLVVELPNSAKRSSITRVLWENWEENPEVFCLVDEENFLSTGVVYFRTVRTPEVFHISQTQLPYGHEALRLHDGEVTCVTGTNRVYSNAWWIVMIAKIRLESHSLLLPDVSTFTTAELNKALDQSIAIYRLRDAWEIASKIGTQAAFGRLANLGMNLLEIEFAIRCYRQIQNSAKVKALEPLLAVEDINLLKGLVLLLLNEPDGAQVFFLNSTKPMEALKMRRDLLHWDQALQLAKNLAPVEIPMISRDFAQDLELSGDYGNALYHYERSVTKKLQLKAHDELCLGGIARMSIRLGEVKKGLTIATEIGSQALLKDCASILDNMKQTSEAAVLYEKAQSWEKAVGLYLKSKNWQKASELIGKCNSQKLHMQYAKAMEANGQYELAAKSYVQSKEYVPAIRIYLDHLDDPEAAVNLVQESESTEGAGLVAKFFLKLNDHASAIHFLVVSRCSEEAFELAKKHHQMTVFADIIGDEGTQGEYVGIAKYFEGRRNGLRAGKAWLMAKDFSRALAQFLLCGDEERDEAIMGAIQVVTKAGSELLVRQLVGYLMGDKDGEPKDAKFLFKMYMSLKQYRDAARTATIIAREDQAVGNYRTAHDVLYRMFSELRSNGIQPATDMVEDLRLLHSYMIAKLHVKRGDHLQAARLLLRAANNISKFPMHTVPILTSTVVEAHRAGMRLTAFNVAKTLMRPEYRPKIDAKYKEKIERMIRRPDRSEIEEPVSPCPYCSSDVEVMRLDCPECKNVLPYCVFTGQHMVATDWSSCPDCQFPALFSQFKEMFGEDETRPCPMCSKDILRSDVILNEDPSAILQELKHQHN